MSAYVVITPPFCFCYFVVFSASQDYFVTVCYRIHFFFLNARLQENHSLKTESHKTMSCPVYRTVWGKLTCCQVRELLEKK